MGGSNLPRSAWVIVVGALLVVAVGVVMVPLLLLGSVTAVATTAALAQVPPAPVQIPPSAPGQPPSLPPAPTRAAAPSPAATAAPQAGITQGLWVWQRTELSDGTVVAPSDPSKYTISFQAEGRLAVRADCNQGSATYTLDGPLVTITPGAMTLAACLNGSQDATFLQGLRDVATYVMDGNTLVLNLKVDGGNMVFSPQPPLSLAGRPWRVTSYNNGSGGVQSVLPDVELTALFDQDGAVSGNAGCNTYRGPYSITGSSITFGPLASTRRACLSDALNAQEQRFLTALGAATQYELVGDRLTLRDGAGATQAILVRPSIQPVPSPAPAAP